MSQIHVVHEVRNANCCTTLA